MMKKMKGGVFASMEKKTPVRSVYEDPRTSFKHQSLMQDYEELQQEMEAMRNKLQIMKQKKMTLSSEVRFLRGRYKYLVENQTRNPKPNQNSVLVQNPQIQSKKARKQKKYGKKETALTHSGIGLDLNRKGKVYEEKETTLQNPIPVFDLNTKMKRNAAPVLDLNQKEWVYTGNEAKAHSMAPDFDLNQISREEEELQFNGEPSWRVVEEPPKKSSLRSSGGDEQPNDMKLSSACRNVGNGGNRTGKRKITWQDQVALRV